MIKKIIKSSFDSDFSEIISQASISLILRLSGQILGFFLTLLIARNFGAHILGDYVLAIAVLRVFSIFSKLGMDIFSVRFTAFFIKKGNWKSIYLFRKKIEILLVCMSIFFSLIMYFFSFEISNIINAEQYYIKLNSFLVLPMTFFMLNYQGLRGLKKIGLFSFYFRVSQAFFSIIIILILLQFFNSKDIPIFTYLASLFIVFVLSTISYKLNFSKKNNNNNVNNHTKKFKYFEMLKISIPLMCAQVVQFIMAWIDKLMLGNMMHPEQVGIYFTAFKLSMIASLSLMAVNSIMGPKFAEIFSKNNLVSLKKIVNQSTNIIFFTTIPVVLIFFLFSEKIMVLFGEEFISGANALIILCVAKLVSSFCGSVGNLLQMSGNQLPFLIILSLGAFINIILNLILIPKMGINGAAFSSLISMFVWNLLMIIFVKKKFGFYTFFNPLK